MNCKQTQSNMALAVGQDLSPSEAELVRRHVSLCPPCAEQWAELKASMHVLQQAKGEPADLQGRSVWGKVSRRIRRQTKPTPQARFNGWIPAFAVAAACLLLVVASNYVSAPSDRLTPAGASGLPGMTLEFDGNPESLPDRFQKYYPDESWRADSLLEREKPLKKNQGVINVKSASGF